MCDEGFGPPAAARVESKSDIGGDGRLLEETPKISHAEIARVSLPRWFLPMFTSRMKRYPHHPQQQMWQEINCRFPSK
jgi:hypothetical protein